MHGSPKGMNCLEIMDTKQSNAESKINNSANQAYRSYKQSNSEFQKNGKKGYIKQIIYCDL